MLAALATSHGSQVIAILEILMDSSPAFSPGQRVTVTITDIAFGGEGVGRMGDFVIFIPFVLPGEEVEAEVTEVKRRFARARLLRVITPSIDRVTPRCRYFGECGGCQYQHISYPAQMALKQKQVADVFERVGGFSGARVSPIVPCPQPYGYRNRIMIRTQWNKPEQKLNIGFIRQDNRLVVDIEECPIAEPAVSQEIRGVRANPPPKGGLKVVLRSLPEGWDVPRDSFFQNNFLLLPGMVEVVREALRAGGGSHLVDVYCGVGFFSLELADLVETFAGVEIDHLAIRAARRNAASRSIKNGEFLQGSAEEALPALLARFTAERTAIILDPPRAGCRPETLQLLRRVWPRQIIYVSCHPATLARDLNSLCADGVYELVRVVPLDMFPQTQHVECVVDLRARAPLRSAPKEPAAETASAPTLGGQNIPLAAGAGDAK